MQQQKEKKIADEMHPIKLSMEDGDGEMQDRNATVHAVPPHTL